MIGRGKTTQKSPADAIGFQPDADELEQQPIPHASRWSLYLLFLLVALIIIWAYLAKVDRIVVAPGKLVTTEPMIVVQPLETSIIRKIMARVGQVVKKNQVLAALDPTFTQADVASLQTRLNSYTSQARRLEAELSDAVFKPKAGDEDDQLQNQLHAKRREAYLAKMQAFRESLGKLEAELNTNQRDQKILAQRLEGLKQIEDMWTRLYEKKAGSRLRMIEARNERLAVRRELDKVKNSEPQIIHGIEEVKAQRKAFVQEYRKEATEQLVATRRERDSLALELNKAQKRKELVLLKSPENAVVLQVAQLSVGSVVRQAETIFTLVPLSSSLEAEVLVASKDIGYIRKNDKARIKFEAFPFQKHGTAEGSVSSISEDSLQQKADTGPGTLAGVFYMARISLQDVKLRSVPRDFRLMPGMILTAEIKVGKRRVISYFLYPLLKAFDESLREP
ncbi:MAG: HlyD family type I secretion periplasmic adaptor subunit [Thermodesulfobacteriota bacterium]